MLALLGNLFSIIGTLFIMAASGFLGYLVIEYYGFLKEEVNSYFLPILCMVIIGLIIGIWKKIESYLKKSDDEKIAIAKQQISQAVLRLISEAERDYGTWREAGQIKRSKVIQEIYQEYPILSKIADQDELIKWIDAEIDNALKELRKVIKANASGYGTPNGNFINVGAMMPYMNYTPRTLDEIITGDEAYRQTDAYLQNRINETPNMHEED